MYLHGGGYVLGSPGVTIPITTALSTSLHVISVDYRLAPEHPFPAAVDDAIAVIEAVGEDDRPVWLGGDSAGGGIALCAAQRCAGRSDGSTPAGLVLLSPHLDHATWRPADDPAHVEVAAMSRAYRGDLAADDPLVSPLRGELAGLPPILIQTGTADHLHQQALAFARRARAAGVVVELDVWIELWHAWHYHPELPEAQRALAEAAAYVNAHRQSLR